jgi:hypothetical protein
MTNHEYLQGILTDEKIDHTVEETKKTRTEVKNFLIKHYKKEKTPTYIYSGSIAKKTAIKSKYDIDIGLQFDNEDFETLEDMFDDVKKTLKKEYGKTNVREQNVSIRIQKNGHDIDIVPGRRIDNNKDDVYLHIEREDDSRIKSNLHIHVNEIENFSETETIKLLKIWRIRKNFKFKSFTLELMTKNALKDEIFSGLDTKFEYMMNYIVDNIDTIRLKDPANSNNIISDSIKDDHKNQIKKFAKRALKCIEKNKWKNIFDESDGKCLTESDTNALAVSFATIAPKPYGF